MTAHVETALKAALGPLVLGRLHPVYLPDQITYPALRYMNIVTDPQNTMQGESDLDNLRMRVDIFAREYDEITTLTRAVRTAMDTTFTYESLCVGEFDVPEPEQRLFHKVLDFSIWANKPTQ